MRVNIYAEEMTDRIEIIEKEVEGTKFTALRFYLYLPVTLPDGSYVAGPFMHGASDDDSSAVTFWGKKDLRLMLHQALMLLDKHYGDKLDYVENLQNSLTKAKEEITTMRNRFEEIRGETLQADRGEVTEDQQRLLRIGQLATEVLHK